MVPWTAPGQLLRWWRRDVLELSQQQAAERLAVQPSALSNWEHGARAISLDIETIDKLLGADGVLAGMLWAFGSVEGLDGATSWSHVYPGLSTPIWVWIRTPGQQVDVVGEWGVFRTEARTELASPNGTFLMVGASVAESPLTVELSSPGWVDFGRGALPDEVPGSTVISALDLMTRSSADGRFMELFASNLAVRLSGADPRDGTALAQIAPKGLASFFAGIRRPAPAETPRRWVPLPDPDAEVDHEVEVADRLRYRRLRRARGLSRATVADLLAEHTGVTAAKETLRRFETDVGQPHDRMLPAALDEVLGANGYLALTTIRSGRGTASVGLPDFWSGPVWLELDGPGPDVVVVLRWGDWSRKLRADVPALLTFTCSLPDSPLRVGAPNDVSWMVGLGRRAGATSIDHNWDPSSVDNAQRALSDTETAFLRALKLKKDRRPPGE